MMRNFIFLILIAVSGNCFAQDAGFTPLLNGKNFDGFEILQRNATPQDAEMIYRYGDDGVLHLFRDLPAGTGEKANPNGTHGILHTKKSYSRYHLKFEYRWGQKLFNNHHQYQYDSGLIYHIKKLKIWPTSLQYQIRFNHLKDRNHTGDLVAGGIDVQWYSKDKKTFALPAEGGVPQPTRMGQHFAHRDADFFGLGEKWNQCEIIVMGDQYAIHKLNGKVVNLITDLGVSEGAIAFEAETAEILFRNVVIKQFDKSQPMDSFLK